MRLFIDQATHLPLMVQYQDPKPMIMMRAAPVRAWSWPRRTRRASAGAGAWSWRRRRSAADDARENDAEARSKRCASTPPQMGTYAMHLADYKKVDGVMLPHKIDISARRRAERGVDG